MRQRNKKNPQRGNAEGNLWIYTTAQTGNQSMYNQSLKVKRISMHIQGLTIGLLLGQQDPETAKARTLDSLRRHGWIVPGVNPSALVRRHHA